MVEVADDTGPSRRGRLILYGVLAAVAILLVAGLWLASRPATPPLQGEVEADSVNVATKALARVDRLMVDEGDRVRAGQVVATLSSPELGNAAVQTAAMLEGARATRSLTDEGARREDVASLRSTWLAAQATADLGAVSARRAETLYAEGVIAAQRRDEARAARDSSARAAEAAHAQYAKAVAGARPQTRRIADAQVRVAQAADATARALLNETRLVSPIAGQVSRRLVRAGEIIGPVLPALQIVDVDHPYVLLTVREDDLHGLSEGQILEGRVPALDRTIAFRVRYLAVQGEFATFRADRQSRGYDVRGFEVRLAPAGPVAGLRPGMSVLFTR
ncbi:HlyD family secretion protein [Sphingomonas beigongshangi]|uniref:HlyD family secretion protein n=1 Tax=Sphingomonas beigongshangi TaxID=2782540 RepID=UPI001AEEACA9|nr:efflux RND transporter periplasmic adaptor subunit [Sphingomonas beigongshangi]